MKANTGVNFHNRFDIEVRDAKTGELKQLGIAENIVLNQMYTRICNFSTYFVNIHFGTGTGTLDPTRTSLFTHLGTKTVVDEEIIKAYPTSKWTRKITLNPEEYVGSTFTEVGVAYGSTNTNLVTHAMIKDSEGNPLTLTKTALDVLVIYATVYITFTDGDTVFANSANRNTLVNYFTTHSSITNTIGLGDYRNSSAPRKSKVHISKSCTRTAGASNKKVTFNTVRFGITEGNGPKNLAVLANALSYDMGIHVGGTISNEVVGTGNGTQTDYRLANVFPDNIIIKIDGVTTADYTIKQSFECVFNHTLDLGEDNGNKVFFPTRYPHDLYVSIPAAYQLDPSAGEYFRPSQAPFARGPLVCDDDSIRYADGNILKYNPTTGNYETVQAISGVGAASRLSHDGKLLIVSKEANGFSIYKWNETTQVFDNIQNISLNRASGCDISRDNRRIVLSKAYASGSSVYNGEIHIYEYNDVTELYEDKQVIYQAGIYNTNSVLVELSPTEEFLVINCMTSSYKVYRYNGIEYVNAVDCPHGFSTSAGFPIFIGSNFFVVWTTAYWANSPGQLFEIRKSNDIISFNTPPAQGAVITANYHVPYIPKDENHVLDVSFELQFGEGT